jgi:methyl-accepting chemotaxis protein
MSNHLSPVVCPCLKPGADVAAATGARAVVAFGIDGTILAVNDAFLAATGYAAEEIVGRHHGTLRDAKDGSDADYRKFWAALARGEFRRGAFNVIAKDGRAVWLRASYNPVYDSDGQRLRVIQLAIVLGEAPAAQGPRPRIGFTADRARAAANDRFLQAMRCGLQGS